MHYMDIALEEAYKGIHAGDGGPFGAVVVKDEKIVGRGHNRVVSGKDPTLHGEIVAIRDACKALDSFDLAGCELYTTAEPCPMCLGAILWAGIDKVYFGCNRDDTEHIGFRDSAFYQILKDEPGLLESHEREKCLKLFEDYSQIDHKTMY